MNTDERGCLGQGTPAAGGGAAGAELNRLTETIIGCAYKISNELGCGFVEKVYENSLVHELRKNGLKASQQHPIQVCYDGVVVSDFVADILVEDTVILELKAVRALDPVHQAQCINYLRATGLPVCLLLNFGKPKVEVRRMAGRRGPGQVLSSLLAPLLSLLGV